MKRFSSADEECNGHRCICNIQQHDGANAVVQLSITSPSPDANFTYGDINEIAIITDIGDSCICKRLTGIGDSTPLGLTGRVDGCYSAMFGAPELSFASNPVSAMASICGNDFKWTFQRTS